MNRKLTTLILITLVLVVITVVAVKHENASVSNAVAGKALFPGLKDKVNDVSLIEAQQGKNSVSVELKDNKWQVKQKDDYSANLNKIKQTILGIADMNLVEAKTRKKDNYDKLQVEDPTGDKARSTLVTLKDDQNKVLASVILGKVSSDYAHPERSTMYVRKGGNDQVWEVTGEVHADATATNWLDDMIINIKPDRVQRVIVTPAEGKSYTVQKTTQKGQPDHYLLTDIPKGNRMKSPGEADGMSRIINGLRLLDVQKAASFDVSKDMDDKKQAKKAVFQTTDGLVIDAELHKQFNNTYITLTASFDASLRPAPPDKGPEDDKAAETNSADKSKTAATAKPANPAPPATGPKLEEIPAVEQEAAQINERVKGWVYRVADSKVSALNKTMADLLESDKPAPKAKAKPKHHANVKTKVKH